MTDEQVYLTEEGYKELKEELEYLRNVRRPEVAERIRSAKEEGDISENAAFEEAKTEQSFLEGRIQTLRSLVNNASIIKEEGPTDMVRLGSKVTVVEEGGEPETFRIVGSAEADPGRGFISNESPVGKALLGHKVGDEVEVRTPGGSVHFTIEDIS